MSIENCEKLNEIQIDVLREIGNIGSGNAVTALSQMINKPVGMHIPAVHIMNVKEAAE